jgi:hypothetical protein
MGINMEIQAKSNQANFNVLAEYLKAELTRHSVEDRAIHLASEASFAKWAHSVLGEIAQQCGVAIGYLVGIVTEAYENIKGSFVRGFQDGLRRGRAKD